MRKREEYTQWFALAGFLLVTLAAAFLGSVLTAGSVDGWYAGLRKPDWTPPNEVFAPVWTVLYLGMAVAAWLVWRRRSVRGARLALALFAVQLALNVAWSGLFFGLESPLAGLVDIVVLWLAILGTLLAFWRVNLLAGLFLVPYLVWVSFAAALNLAIWRSNVG